MKKSPIRDAAANVPDQFYHSIGGVSDITSVNLQIEDLGAVFNTTANSWGQDYSNLTPNLSSRPALQRGHYDQYRPQERVPIKHKDIVKFAQQAYEKVGLIRNIID